LRQPLAQRSGAHQFGGRDPRSNSAQPRSERFPDKLREDRGEILKQALSDEPGLDEDLIRAELALDVIAILERTNSPELTLPPARAPP
jgi:hypothetical protein